LYIFSVKPTALSSRQDHGLDVLSSSRDDVIPEEVSMTYQHLREKRFFYANKNLFVVSSTVTSYAFVNTTTTVTVNLLPAADVAALACVAGGTGAVPAAPICVACLPAGFIVCPLAG
jgi:hypothetical protein